MNISLPYDSWMQNTPWDNSSTSQVCARTSTKTLRSTRFEVIRTNPGSLAIRGWSAGLKELKAYGGCLSCIQNKPSKMFKMFLAIYWARTWLNIAPCLDVQNDQGGLRTRDEGIFYAHLRYVSWKPWCSARSVCSPYTADVHKEPRHLMCILTGAPSQHGSSSC